MIQVNFDDKPERKTEAEADLIHAEAHRNVIALFLYVGPDQRAWLKWDAAELLKDSMYAGKILIDQGSEDKFLAQQLRPDLLRAAAAAAERPLTLRLQPGYDHSYYFISSFIEDHLEFHAVELARRPKWN